MSAIGATFPLHCTANGKAALSLMSNEEVAALLPSRLARHTPATITRRSDLLEEIGRVRTAGVAVDREEHTAGISAAGIALRAPDGAIVALSVPAPTQRFEANARQITAALEDAFGAARRALKIN